MMKKVTAAIVLCLMSASAFAAAPAFDSPEQEAAHYQQERARQAFEERYTNQTASECASYYAVPAFDSPEQEAAHYQQEQARQAFEERYTNQTASENASYHAVRAFDSPEQEAAYYDRVPNGKPLKRCFISPATINWRQIDGTLPICKNACAVFLFI